MNLRYLAWRWTSRASVVALLIVAWLLFVWGILTPLGGGLDPQPPVLVPDTEVPMPSKADDDPLPLVPDPDEVPATVPCDPLFRGWDCSTAPSSSPQATTTTSGQPTTVLEPPAPAQPAPPGTLIEAL